MRKEQKLGISKFGTYSVPLTGIIDRDSVLYRSMREQDSSVVGKTQFWVSSKAHGGPVDCCGLF